MAASRRQILPMPIMEAATGSPAPPPALAVPAGLAWLILDTRTNDQATREGSTSVTLPPPRNR
eukprot:scaffold428972_cov52-Prasinocladus_malaysianus.AAC.2